MNRRSYLGGIVGLASAASAGCLGRLGGSDDVNGPTLDASQYTISPETINTTWLPAPENDEGGYDFGFVDPQAILAMEHQWAGIGANVQLAGSRHFTWWSAIDAESIEQLTFVDRREPDAGFEAGAFVAEGELDRDAILDEVPEFFGEWEIDREREVEDAQVIIFESGDVIAVDDGFVVLSIEPFRRGKDRRELVERILAAHEGSTDRYLEADADFAEMFEAFDESHLLDAGKGERMELAPDDALATAENLTILGAFAEIVLVAIFESDADAEHATQFDPSFEHLAEVALTADTQVRGRMTITTQRVDTDVVDTGDEEFDPEAQDGFQPDPGIPGN